MGSCWTRSLLRLHFRRSIDALRETGTDVSADGVCAGGFLLMDDVALPVNSNNLRAPGATLWKWCWRGILEPYPGHPKTFVVVLGPGAVKETAACVFLNVSRDEPGLEVV